MRPYPYDLFGEIPVTWEDIDAWCLVVAGIAPESWRRPYYIQGWDVAGKIRAAKAAGEFDRIVGQDVD